MQKTGVDKNCAGCGKEFYVPGWRSSGKYCSRECYWKDKVGKEPWNKGLTGLQKGNSGSFTGGKTSWTGTISEYKSLHYWVSKYLGKPCVCEKCGDVEQGKKIHWANKSGEYKKEKGDWVRLCAKCHYQFDKQYERRKKNK